MPAVFTTKLGSVNSTGPGDVLLYTVPAGHHVVVRDIVAFRGTGTVPMTVYVQPGGSGGAYTLAYLTSSSGFDHVDLRQAINVGDSVRVNTGGTTFQVAVTGYDFTGG